MNRELHDGKDPRERVKDPPYALRALAMAVFAFALTSLAQPPVTVDAAPNTPAPAPAQNWVLPIFTDKEGYRVMIARGTDARDIRRGVYQVTDLSITTFSGDADARVDSILLSPDATFYSDTNRAAGDKHVRFIRDDIEVTGIGWTYDHATRKISILSNVRVTFRTHKINDILK